LTSACNFAQIASQIEMTSFSKKESDDVINVEAVELNSYVTSVIFSTVAFLEACINEFFCDIHEANAYSFKVSTKEEKLIQEMWNAGIPRSASYSILDKYQVALSLLGKSKLDKSKGPSQDVKEIVNLRNALVHYEPEWRDWVDSKNSQDNFHKRLRGKFETNKLFSSKEPFFPNLCLGSGCANWAVQKAVQFTDEFYAQIDQDPNYRYIVKKLYPWTNTK
jgi:hypothetical protein